MFLKYNIYIYITKFKIKTGGLPLVPWWVDKIFRLCYILHAFFYELPYKTWYEKFVFFFIYTFLF